MTNILFLTFTKLYPLNSGYALRTYNICKALTENGNKVFLIYFNYPEDQESSDKGLINKITEDTLSMDFPNSLRQNYGTIYKIFLSVYPFQHIPFVPREIRAIQKNLKYFIEMHNIDIIHVQGLIASLFLLNFHKTPELIDLTDSLSLFYKREIAEEKCFQKKITNYLLYNWSRRMEKTLLKNSDVITVVSPVDKNMLKSLYRKARIEIISNGIDCNYFSSRNMVIEGKSCILFHGTMDFKPNISTVKYIINEIFPIIKSKVPDTKFFIVGSNPISEIKKLDNKNDIVVTGWVEDIRKYISKSSIVLVPMISGSGIKNKILEAMAMEKPVVTNQIGAEAFNEQVKNCLLIGENKYEIANHVINLLRDREKGIELGKKSREIVLKEYSWNKVAEKYEKFYKEIIKNQ